MRTSIERARDLQMNFETLGSYEDLSARAASLLLEEIARDPRTTLGLPTGRTPLGMYANVVARCARETHCFGDVTTFNLDEYAGIPAWHPGSYATYMRSHLFAHVDADPSRTHIPDGAAPDGVAECARYEEQIRAAGGIRLTFLGLGRNGHIGFNEPGTPFDSRTRVVELTPSTRAANADLFPGEEVPRQALTMGIGTILESARIVLLASGASKREAVARLRTGEVGIDFPGSALWRHPDVTVLVAP